MISPLEQLQSDIVGIISGSPFFATITVIREDSGVTESDAQLATQATAVKGGKVGAAVIIFQSEEEPLHEDAPGPEDKVTTLIRVLEVPEVNRSAQGTGITARRMATKIRRLLHLISVGPIALRAGRAHRYNDGEGTIGFDIVIQNVLNLQPEARVMNPQIGPGNPLQIACNTPGAQIYYTTDGSFPAQGSGTSALYAGAFTVPVNTLVRAVAYPPNNSTKEASGISALFVKTAPVLPQYPTDSSGAFPTDSSGAFATT